MKATKKLIAAAVSLVAAASLTVGSTFAWFSYQSSVELGEVKFSVDSSDENLQVAVVAYDESNPVTPDESAFSYSLSVNDIKDKINGGKAIAYQPLTVSGVGADNSVAEANPITLVNEEKAVALTSSGSYAVFDLVFRYAPAKISEGMDMPSLVLNSGSQITADDIGATTSDTTFAWDNFDATDYGVELDKDDPINARARDAARVAFVLDDGSGGYKNKVWAPSEKLDVATSLTSDRARGFYLHNLASDYKIKQKDSVTLSASPAPTYASRVYAGPVNPTSVNDFLCSSIAKFPDLNGKSYSELRLTVKVWLEGNDGDCIESFKNDSFAFLLKFRTDTIKSAT